MIITFLIGVCGSATFLFLYLLFQGDLEMLENKVINSKKTMTFIYVIVGGFATLMWSLSSLNTLDLSDVFQVYTIGIGWQGLVTGIISAKDAKEGKKSEEQKDFTKKMIEERNEFYKRYKDSLDI